MLSPVTVIVRQMLRSHLNGACIDDPVVNPPARRRSWPLTAVLRTRASGGRRREIGCHCNNEPRPDTPPSSARPRAMTTTIIG
jgi:hypothetical protein